MEKDGNKATHKKCRRATVEWKFGARSHAKSGHPLSGAAATSQPIQGARPGWGRRPKGAFAPQFRAGSACTVTSRFRGVGTWPFKTTTFARQRPSGRLPFKVREVHGLWVANEQIADVRQRPAFLPRPVSDDHAHSAPWQTQPGAQQYEDIITSSCEFRCAVHLVLFCYVSAMSCRTASRIYDMPNTESVFTLQAQGTSRSSELRTAAFQTRALRALPLLCLPDKTSSERARLQWAFKSVTSSGEIVFRLAETCTNTYRRIRVC